MLTHARARRVTLAVAVATLLVTATSATAVPPEIERPTSSVGNVLEIPADEGCPFATVIEFTKGKEGSILFEDRVILTSPGLAVRVSRADDPDVFADLTISGTIFQEVDGGETIRSKATGQNLIWTYPDQPDSFMVWTSGRVDLVDDGETLQIDARSARVIDVCALLS